MAFLRSSFGSISAATSATDSAGLYHARRGLAIALVATCLAVVYSFATPIFEAPDEIWHFAYVQQLARGQGLPVVDPAHPGALAQEAAQPPLYYALAAALTFWIDPGDQLAAVQQNPHAAIGLSSPRGNINRMLPVDRGDRRFQKLAWAVQLARLVSALLAGLTVLATYGLARELWPARPGLAAGAAAVAAFTPQFLFISGSVNNDPAVVALSTLGTWQLARSLRRGPSRQRWLALGVTIGLAALAKLGGLLLLPLAVAALALDGIRRRDLRLAAGGPAVVGLGAALVAGWWYVRNQLLYGDPLALGVHLAIAGRRNPVPSVLDLLPELEGLRRSYWAMFGWFNLPAPVGLYAVYDLLTGLALLGCVVYCLRRLRRRAWADLAAVGLLLAWSGLVLAGLVRWTQATPATQGRLLFPAIGALAGLLFLGLAELAPAHWTGRLAASLGGGMALVATAVPLVIVRPAYAPPAPLSPAAVDGIPNRRDANFSGRVRLLGYSYGPLQGRAGGAQAESPPSVAQDGWLEIRLYWQALAPMDRDYSAFAHLVDEAGAIAAQEDSYPGQGTLPTTRWAPGVAIADRLAVRIPALAQAPRMRRIEVGVYDVVTGERLKLPQGEDQLVLGDVRIEPALSGGRVPAIGPDLVSRGVTPVWVDFAGQIALVGYALEPTAAAPGGQMRLTLYWQALKQVSVDYTIFAHVLGPENSLVAGDDSQPAGGQHATSGWSPGEIVEDTHTLTIDPQAPAGQFPLEVGLYRRQSGRRLRVTGTTESRVVVGQVRIIR